MNILTFDLEDWFHILDFEGTSSPQSWEKFESRVEKNTDRILDLLAEKNLRATWFCLGWVAKKYPALIRKVATNHDIGCHSMEHQLVFQQKPAEVREDLHQNILLLEDLCGKKVNAYRAPGFSFTSQTKWLVDILLEEGIVYDSSVFPIRRNHGGFGNFPSAEPCRILFNGGSLKEFPMNMFSFAGRSIVFSGGGYFRLLPYWIIKRMMRKSDYVMTYFHPRDFDSLQPVLQGLSRKRKFMSYTGLKNSFYKLNRLLNDHKFITIEQAGSNINWDKTPSIKLENY